MEKDAVKRSRAGLGPDTNITVCKSFNTPKRLSPPDQDHLRPCSTAAVRFNETVCYPFAKPEGTGPALHGDCALPPLAADLCQREGKAVWALPSLSPGQAGPAVLATTCTSDCFRSSRSPVHIHENHQALGKGWAADSWLCDVLVM